MKIATRINARVTSINVRDSVCALHYVICSQEGSKPANHILDTCHAIIGTWKGKTARGLSSFICDAMIEELLSTEDKDLYFDTIQRIKNGY